MQYRVDVYYSGYITRQVEADNPQEAKAMATEEVARFHNKREGDFIEEFMPTLEPWPEAGIAEENE